MLQKCFGTLPQICASTQYCLGVLRCHALVEVFYVYLHVLGQARVWHGVFVLWCVLSWGFGVYVFGIVASGVI